MSGALPLYGRPTSTPLSITGEFAATLIASSKRAVSNGVWGWFDDDMAFFRDWGFSLDVIGVPVALWQGKLDKMVPFAHGEWLAAHVAAARAGLFDEHGHLCRHGIRHDVEIGFRQR